MARHNRPLGWLVTRKVDGVRYVWNRNKRWVTNAGCISKIKTYLHLGTLERAMLRSNVENWEAYALYEGYEVDCCGNVHRFEGPHEGCVKVVACENGRIFAREFDKV